MANERENIIKKVLDIKGEVTEERRKQKDLDEQLTKAANQSISIHTNISNIEKKPDVSLILIFSSLLYNFYSLYHSLYSSPSFFLPKTFSNNPN